MRNSSPDLSLEERLDIYMLRSTGKGIREIGRILNRAHSTISVELSRFKRMNRRFRRSWLRLPWYEKAKYAHEHSLGLRLAASKVEGVYLKNERIRRYVYECLSRRGWSPERISLRIKIDLPGETISHEAIYQYIFSKARELIKYLKRCSKKGRQPRSSGKRRRAKDENKRRIDTRPASVDKREDYGDHESDLIVSCRGGKSCLLVFVERKTRRVYIRKVSDRQAETLRITILQILNLLPAEARKTLTVDNGTEHEWLPRLENVFSEDGFLVYYCNAYSPWERWTVEAMNGVIRNKFPKGTNFDLVSDEAVAAVEDWVNTLPMKCHDGYTPEEMANLELSKLAA